MFVFLSKAGKTSPQATPTAPSQALKVSASETNVDPRPASQTELTKAL